MIISTIRRYVLSILLGLLMAFCQKQESAPIQSSFKIALMMPLSGSLKGDWDVGIDWIKSTINKNGGVAGRKIEVEWFDSQMGNIEELARKIASDTTIVAAIGPFTSSNALKSAPYFIQNKKLMLTTASSSELTRAFAGKDYIWRLMESDISQCKNLVLIAKNKNIKSIGLITGDDEYGMTFYNWFGFFASEMGLEVTHVEKFHASLDDISSNMQAVLNSKPELIVCIPSNLNQAAQMSKEWKNRLVKCQILFSDILYMPEVLCSSEIDSEGLEGTVMIPDPNNGFAIEYEIKYGKKPLLGMAQMYDALMLIAYALEISNGANGESLMDGLKMVVDSRDGNSFWDDDGVCATLQQLRKGIIPDIIGASGELNYDDELYLDVLFSTYAHWQINQNEFVTLNYYSDDGKGRHSSTSSSWRTYANNLEELKKGSELSLPAKENLQVLLISSSKGWANYRHQADLLAYYQLLKNNGVSDSNIVLILEDDLVNHQRNNEPGVIRNSMEETNLYYDVEIDYYLNTITLDDVFNILSGVKTATTPVVLSSSDKTNILFYFVDHGSPEGLIFEGKEDAYLTPQIFKSKLNEFANHSLYRRLLILIEACYSGNMGEVIDFKSPIMCITAANSHESSKAIYYSNTLNTWLSNNFSYQLYKQLKEDPNVSISDLYIHLNKKVNGSHVSIYNEENFGNLYLCKINEFFNP